MFKDDSKTWWLNSNVWASLASYAPCHLPQKGLNDGFQSKTLKMGKDVRKWARHVSFAIFTLFLFAKTDSRGGGNEFKPIKAYLAFVSKAFLLAYSSR